MTAILIGRPGGSRASDGRLAAADIAGCVRRFRAQVEDLFRGKGFACPEERRGTS